MRLRIDSNAADQNVPTIAGAATFKFEIEKSFGQVFWAHSNPKFVEANFHSHWIPERDRPRSGEAPPNFNFNIGYQF